MNGILSTHPAPAVARPLVGALVLFLVQAGFVLHSPDLASGLRTIVILIALVGAGALTIAVIGIPETPDRHWGGRHG